jgi:2,3,4,5-tetrahydropyridine-2-carboxylate N-succinyltransferase
MFINIGSWVDDGTMVDSHALVGSCAQIGKRVHLSAAAQIGGVLEPPGAVPVIIEDEVFVGGNCGVYEGVIVGERAVLAPGVLLTGGVTVFDAVREMEYRKSPDAPLMIPPGAVLVPGTRPANGPFAAARQLSLYAPVIVKYRDEKTDAATSLEESLR